jgi:hypothetical protein
MRTHEFRYVCTQEPVYAITKGANIANSEVIIWYVIQKALDKIRWCRVHGEKGVRQESISHVLYDANERLEQPACGLMLDRAVLPVKLRITDQLLARRGTKK